jgi:hypothetical protein
MARGTSTRRTGSTPQRSASALRAYAAGSVTSTIDLTRSPGRVTQRADDVAVRNGVLLGVLATTVWAYDLVRVLAG